MANMVEKDKLNEVSVGMRGETPVRDLTRSNVLSRGEFMDAGGALVGGLILALKKPEIATTTTKELSMPKYFSLNEEIPGAIDLNLTPGEVYQFEKEWAEIKDQHDFDYVEDYIVKFGKMLNMTRARNLDVQEFVETVSNFLDEPNNIDGKELSIKDELKKLTIRVGHIRDKALKGEVPTAEYGIVAAQLIQSTIYSYTLDCGGIGNWNLNRGRQEMAFAPLLAPELGDVAEPDRLYYYSQPIADNGLPKKYIFDSSVYIPQTGLIQKPLNWLDDFMFGDIVFVDKSEGLSLGHPLVAVCVDRDDHYSILDSERAKVLFFDGNANGRMIATCRDVDGYDYRDYFPIGNVKFGILRTVHAEKTQFLDRKHAGSILPEKDLHEAIATGRQEKFPPFSTIPTFNIRWNDFADPLKRSEAICDIISSLGLHVIGADGEITNGPRWRDTFGNQYWLCNIYSAMLMRALGINDIGHWFVNDKPADNRGVEYDAANMHGWLNRRGREFNFIDVSMARPEELDKMLAQGYVFYGASGDHTFVTVPMVNDRNVVIGAISQAASNYPLAAPNDPYKEYPRLYYVGSPNLKDKGIAIMWAHLLPNVKEPTNPYRTELFSYSKPENTKNLDVNNSIGWLTTREDIKQLVNDFPSASGYRRVLEEIVYENKIPEGNHIFNYAFDLVKTIQEYRLPVGVSWQEDSDLFVSYLQKSLKEKGYGKIVDTPYFQAILNNSIKPLFTTNEKSLSSGGEKPFQPVKCFGLVQLLDAAKGHINHSPASIGGIVEINPQDPRPINAQEVAKNLLNRTENNLGESVINRDTVAIHFDNNIPKSFEKFKAGDSIFFAYPGKSEGHVCTILTDPFIDANGKTVVAVADSNRYVTEAGDLLRLKSDGMPRIRIMTYDEFIKQYMNDKYHQPIGQAIILRSLVK